MSRGMRRGGWLGRWLGPFGLQRRREARAALALRVGAGAALGMTLGVALLLLAPPSARAQARAPAPAPEPQLALQVGAQQTLEVPGLQRVKVGDPGVADVRTGEASRLTVKGMTPGRTTLTVWTGDTRTTYDVVVR